MRAFVVLASLVIAGPSFAQSLLVEMRDAEMFCFDCPRDNITLTLDGSFSTGAVQPWLQLVTTNDIGATFTMPSDLLDDFAAGLTRDDPGLHLAIELHNAGAGGNVNSDAITFGTLLNNPEVFRYAPVLGRNLTGYTISSITHTLNSLVITPIASNRFNLSGNSTVRIYGITIPEPCTLFLVLILAIHPLRLRHSLRYFGPRSGLT
jgi:hypothetical protein